MIPSLLPILGLAASVSAHGYIKEILTSSGSFPGYNPTIAPWVAVQDTPGWQNWATDTGFVSSASVSTPDIICHLNSTNAIKSATVAAGDTISLKWTGWATSHKGPVMDYLAACDGACETTDKTALEWVKIAEQGQFELGEGGGKTGYWAADKLFETDFVWFVTIPAGLKAGNYVLRHEILALHGAYAEGGAQFYPQCINLQVQGEGEGSLEGKGTVGTDLYEVKGEGVLYNIYNDETKPTYKIPGPPVYVV